MIGTEFTRVIATAEGRVRARFERLAPSSMFVFRQDVVLPARQTTSGREALFGEGAIAIPRRDDAGRTTRRYAVYPYGVFEALRACLHAREGYGVRYDAHTGELQTVRMTHRAAADALRLLSLWSDLTAEQRVQLDALTARLVAVSEHWRNVFKREAADRFAASLYAEDDIGRKNPLATAAKLAAAQRSLVFRVGEIGQIAPWVGLRETTLFVEIDRIYDILTSAWRTLGEVADFCGDGIGSVAERLYRADEIRRVGVMLASVHVEPFVTNFGASARDCATAARELIRGRTPNAIECLNRAREPLRYKFAQFQLEEALRHFSLALAMGTFRDGDRASLIARVLDFRRRLQKLRIRGMRHDPYEEVRTATDVAVVALRQHCLDDAKTALKDASHAM